MCAIPFDGFTTLRRLISIFPHSAKTQKPAKKTEEKAVEEDKPAEPKVEEAAKPEEAKTEEVAPVAEKKVEEAKPEEVKEAAAPVAAVEAPAAEQAKPAT